MERRVDGRHKRKDNLSMVFQIVVRRAAFFYYAIGDNVHYPYFNKGIEGVKKVLKGRDMDLFSRTVKKGKAKEFPQASLARVFMDGFLHKYAALDGPFFVVGLSDLIGIIVVGMDIGVLDVWDE